jgi:hypothetical protein
MSNPGSSPESDPLAKWKRLLEVNELRARDAEARLRYLEAELQLIEVSEKLAIARKARENRGMQGPQSIVEPELEGGTQTESVSEKPKKKTGGKRSRVWKWSRNARQKG